MAREGVLPFSVDVGVAIYGVWLMSGGIEYIRTPFLTSNSKFVLNRVFWGIGVLGVDCGCGS